MNKRAKNQNGFTLPELLVSISVFIIITMMTFMNYPRFKDEIELKRMAQEIASGIRQAQVYGLGVREYSTGVFPGYGIYFNKIANPKSFILFADLDEDSEYDSPGEMVETFQIQTNSKIDELCGSPICTSLNNLNIVYLRPYPTVTLKENGVSTEYSDVEIRIVSTRNSNVSKKIIVSKTGQIAVE